MVAAGHCPYESPHWLASLGSEGSRAAGRWAAGADGLADGVGAPTGTRTGPEGRWVGVAISYRDTVARVRPDQLEGGFFAGWPNHPDPSTHLRLMRGSQWVWIAVEDAPDQVVGFITAVGDGVLSAYIPLLEVLGGYRGRGIGRELVTRMLATLRGLYMVDLSCDVDLVPFYEPWGFRPGTAMWRREYTAQGGRGVESG